MRPTRDGLWRRPSTFWAAAAALALVLLALLPVMSNGSVGTPDDGVYAAQAAQLADGSWNQPRPAPNVDVDGSNSAVGPNLVYGDQQVPYHRHPLFPLVLAPLFQAGGFGGLILFSIVGVWGAAVTAGLLARRLSPALGVPTLWLTGIGSPLLFDAYLVSAHGAAAAAAGLLALGVCQLLDGGRRLALVYMLPSCAALVLLRSEGIVLVLALGAVLFAEGLVPALRRQAPRWGSVATGALVVGIGVLAYLADAAWSRSIVSSLTTAPAGLGRPLIEDRDPLAAIWASLLRPWYPNALNAQAAIVIAACAIILAAVTLKLMPSRWLFPLSLLLVAAIASMLQQFGDLMLISGLFAAFPVLVAGLILLTRADLLAAPTLRLLMTSALAACGLVFTIYAEGGAAEWGGRFFHILLPLLVPLTMLGLHRGWLAFPSPQRVGASILVVVSVLSFSVLGLRYLHVLRAAHHDLVTSVLAFADHEAGSAASGPNGSKQLVIVGLLEPDGLSRIFWSSGRRADVVVAIGAGDLFRVVKAAEDAGYQSITVVSNLSAGEMITVSKKWLDQLDWVILKGQQAGNTAFGVYQLGPRPQP